LKANPLTFEQLLTMKMKEGIIEENSVIEKHKEATLCAKDQSEMTILDQFEEFRKGRSSLRVAIENRIK
jgi:hypothetical protein